VPWATGETTVRSYLVWPQVDATEPALRIGRNALAVDFRVPARAGWLKVGTNSDAGWAAYLWKNQALKSSVKHVAKGNYPEGGGTVTFYNSGKTPDEGFCEVENVGPLTRVAAGQIVSMEQRLEIRSGVKLMDDGPDAWLKAMEKAGL